MTAPTEAEITAALDVLTAAGWDVQTRRERGRLVGPLLVSVQVDCLPERRVDVADYVSTTALEPWKPAS